MNEDAKAPWVRLSEAAEELRTLEPALHGTVHPLATVDGVLELGEGSVIKAGCVIEGHVRIGKRCTIGPNAYIRGETSIGDDCLIGNAVEVKSSLLGHHVAIAHLSYVGDSVLGNDINIGGGCILSNFRHDAGEIRMPWGGRLQATGRNKLGCAVGTTRALAVSASFCPGAWLKPERGQSPAA